MDISNSQISNIFDFATEQARTIVYLHLFDLAICLLIALTVMGLLTYIAIKFRYRSGDVEPAQNPGNVKTRNYLDSNSGCNRFNPGNTYRYSYESR